MELLAVISKELFQFYTEMHR